MEQVGQHADFALRDLERVPGIVERFEQRCAVLVRLAAANLARAGAREREADREQVLPGRIVQVLGDPPPLVDLRGQQALGEVADLLFGKIPVGDVLGNPEDEFDLARARCG